MRNTRALPARLSSLMIDALEPRRLLSYSATDYFPLSTSARWNYTLTQGSTTFSDVRSAAATRVNGKPASIVKDALSGNGMKVTLSRTYTCSSTTGLQVLAQANAAGLGAASVTFGKPMTFLKASFVVGTVVKWSKLPITGTLPVNGTRINVVGTDTGSSKVVGLESVTLASGQVFPSAIRVLLSHTQTVSGSYQGYHGTLTSAITETAWFVKGVGIVKGTGKVAATMVVPGQGTDKATYLSSQLLTSSNRLPSFAQLNAGTLSVNGTSGNDVMNLSESAGILTATVNGQSLYFKAAGVSGLALHGQPGNDTITNSTARGAVIFGDDGNDTLTGGPGADSLLGGDGDDHITGGPGTDEIAGNAGTNEIIADDGEIDTLHEVQSADLVRKDVNDLESPDPLLL